MTVKSYYVNKSKIIMDYNLLLFHFKFDLSLIYFRYVCSYLKILLNNGCAMKFNYFILRIY